MRYWTPEPHVPQLADWWRPLVLAGRRALEHEVPWLILVDDWELSGRVVRQKRPDVWVYTHLRTRRPLFVDETGQTYRFIDNLTGPSPGRFKEIGIRAAIRQTGLPSVDHAVWFEPPTRLDDGFDGAGESLGSGEAQPLQPPALRLVR